MIFASSESRKVIRDLANEFGIDLEDYGYVMQGGESSLPTTRLNRTSWSANLFKPLERVFTKPVTPIVFEDGVGMIV
jgi:hypothetical protein